MTHPRDILLGAQAGAVALPVCDHYSGVEARMRKSLALQAERLAASGACLFDVTLDCEDGAPVGGETDHAHLVCELLRGVPAPVPGQVRQRVGVRVHPSTHTAFEAEVALIAGLAAERLAYLMVPKVETVADVLRAAAALDAAGAPQVPLHALIESPAAVQQAFDIAAVPRVQSLSFGLMDFVSAHGGAIPAEGMGVQGQFSHPLVLRAKLEIASACHAHGKVPSHCVVTEFRDRDALAGAARRAARELGYTRMWSIHPDQIDPILQAFAPGQDELDQAARILLAAAEADWGPVADQGVLHDRASYRFHWQVLERAHQTGCAMPKAVQAWFAPDVQEMPHAA